MKTATKDTLESNSIKNTIGIDPFTIFHQLKTLTSVKDKEALLMSTKGRSEEYLCQMLNWNLNPYTMFHIKEIPEYVANPVGLQKSQNYRAFSKLLDRLSARKVTGNAAKEEVRDFFMNSHAEEAGWYELILSKGPIGVGAKTVNKVWPKLVPVFDLMLAPNELPVVTQVKFPRYIQPKVDDYRAVYKSQALWSRSGMTFANENLDEHFSALFEVSDYVVDGGLYAHGIKFNALQKILNNQTAPLPKTLKFHVWDCIPVQDWEYQSCNLTYEKRLKLLREVVANIGDRQKIIDIPTDLVQSSKEAIEHYKKYLKQGYEGGMLKDPQGLYRWKRVSIKSGEVMKLKPYKSVDLEIKGIYDGEGERKGIMAGGVTVDYKGVDVRCGSGFDHPTLKDMMHNPDNYIGKTIEIRYLEVTEDGSLRHPSFTNWREEKD